MQQKQGMQNYPLMTVEAIYSDFYLLVHKDSSCKTFCNDYD